MKLSKTALIITLTICSICLTATTLAALSTSVNIPLNGAITAINLGVYTDSGCTQTCTALNIGAITPGSSQTQTVYVKNTGNTPETITLTTGTWSPSNADTYISLTWNRQNTVLSAGESTAATITITAASDCSTLTTFSCSVTITGTQ